jgi:hypothetical protein
MTAMFARGNDRGFVVAGALVLILILFLILGTFRNYAQILAKTADNLENKFMSRIESINSDVKKKYEIH